MEWPGKEGVQAGPLDRVQVGRAGVQAESKLTAQPARAMLGGRPVVPAGTPNDPGLLGARVVQGLLGYWGCCWSSKVW